MPRKMKNAPGRRILPLCIILCEAPWTARGNDQRDATPLCWQPTFVAKRRKSGACHQQRPKEVATSLRARRQFFAAGCGFGLFQKREPPRFARCLPVTKRCRLALLVVTRTPKRRRVRGLACRAHSKAAVIVAQRSPTAPVCVWHAQAGVFLF